MPPSSAPRLSVSWSPPVPTSVASASNCLLVWLDIPYQTGFECSDLVREPQSPAQGQVLGGHLWNGATSILTSGVEAVKAVLQFCKAIILQLKNKTALLKLKKKVLTSIFMPSSGLVS